MRRTNFANVSGLPDERQVTTARDLAKLARAIIIAFPDHADLFTTVQVQVGKQIMRTPCKVSGKSVARAAGRSAALSAPAPIERALIHALVHCYLQHGCCRRWLIRWIGRR
jgi:hypothetical protein